ncbi:MAG TPA: transglycosylase domain-containing protein, partial [Bacilli bacterium]
MALIIINRILSSLIITIKWFIIMAIIVGIGAGAVVAGYTAALVKDDPIRHKEEVYVKMNENAETGFVYFNDATVVGQLRTDEDRRLVEFTEIPQHLIDAFTSTEDHEFFNHPGIDMKGTIRAFKQKMLKEDIQTGGSTITQQLARIVFLSLDRTDNRKVKEIFLSLRLERMLSKEEILTAYLNKIPFGNGASGYNVFGVKAAAKGIFDIDDLNKINVAQVAYLAGLPKAPSDYSAFSSKGEFDEKRFTLAEKRQKFVLSEMLAEQKITDEQYEEALNFDLKGSLSKIKPKAYTTYPYLMIEAERKASEILLRIQNPELTLEDLSNPENEELIKDAQDHMLRGGYKIYTTIDKTIYDAMQEIAKNPENFSKDHPTKGTEQIGAITMNNKTGAILGMMEGRDFYLEQLNHATQMKRQPGSAMKPIGAYIPALELGVIQPGGIIDDIPLILKDGANGYHIPENWDNKFHGLITARRALNQSYNIPAIKLFTDERIGIATAWDYARKMGITTLTESDNFAQTGVIGGLEYGVSVEELTNAYSTIANKGVFNDAYMISKIEDAQGNTIYNHESNPSTVFSPETAYLMTDMLRTVITAGTATEQMKNFKFYKKIPIVGKTGSTQNDHDAWFMGYTPDISTGVWAGYDQPSTLTKGQGTQRAKRI